MSASFHPSAGGYVFKDFVNHKSGTSPNARLTTLRSLRHYYPDHHIASVNPRICDFLGFASAGHAEASLVVDDDNVERERRYVPPAKGCYTREGTLADSVQFGQYRYLWKEKEFMLLRISWKEGSDYCVTKWWFVLFPKTSSSTATTTTRCCGASPEDSEQQTTTCEDGKSACSSIGTDSNSPDTDELILACGRWSAVPHDEIYIFQNGYWDKSKEVWESIAGHTWDNVILDSTMKNALIGDIHGFFESQELYRTYNVPWKRGIIFHGSPGNGKTLSIKSIISHLSSLENPIPSLWVKTIAQKNETPQYSINDIFTHARRCAPCVLIFEDLDSLVTDEVRSFFLNEVDGLDSNDGILMIGSTNHLEKLDAAVTKRPSRFDRKYHFRLPGWEQRRDFALYWKTKLEKNLTDDHLQFPEALAGLIADITSDFSFAYLKELFVMTLLTIARGGRGEDSPPNADWDVLDSASSQDGGEAKDKPSAREEKREDSSTGPKRRELPAVDVPEELRGNLLFKVIMQQAALLLKDMDDTDSGDDDKEKEKGKCTEGPNIEVPESKECANCRKCTHCGK